MQGAPKGACAQAPGASEPCLRTPLRICHQRPVNLEVPVHSWPHTGLFPKSVNILRERECTRGRLRLASLMQGALVFAHQWHECLRRRRNSQEGWVSVLCTIVQLAPWPPNRARGPVAGSCSRSPRNAAAQRRLWCVQRVCSGVGVWPGAMMAMGWWPRVRSIHHSLRFCRLRRLSCGRPLMVTPCVCSRPSPAPRPVLGRCKPRTAAHTSVHFRTLVCLHTPLRAPPCPLARFGGSCLVCLVLAHWCRCVRHHDFHRDAQEPPKAANRARFHRRCIRAPFGGR